jgi:parallel beta-helix repeat protein
MKRVPSSFAALVLAGQFAIFPPAQAAETFHTCAGFIDSLPATISSQGTWCLRKNVSTSITSGSAITIAANNVTIDCNEFKVGGLGGGINTAANGIAAQGQLNATIRNCNVRGFRNGIYLSGAAAAVVQDNRLDQNTERGVYVEGEGTLVQRNQVNDTGSGPAAITSVIGIYTSGTATVADNIVQDVIASNGTNVAAYGMRIVGGVGASVSGNLVRNPVANGTGQAHGIYTSNGTKVFITGNRVAATNSTGIGIRCNASNGSMKDNVAWGFAEPFSCLDDGGNASH